MLKCKSMCNCGAWFNKEWLIRPVRASADVINSQYEINLLLRERGKKKSIKIICPQQQNKADMETSLAELEREFLNLIINN